MKRILTGIGIIVLCTVASQGQDIKISRLGAHGGYSIGGDIDKSSSGFGAQTELSINSKVSMELAMSRFTDSASDSGISMDMDLTTIGLSGVYRASIADKMQGYLLGGCNYNITKTDANLAYAVYRNTATLNVNVDNKVGFHVGVGVNCMLQTNWELLAEYRYTFLKLHGDLMASGPNGVARDSFDGDYNFGLLKVGVNYVF